MHGQQNIKFRTLVSSANIMGPTKEFLLRRGNLYISQPIKVPGFTLGEPHPLKKNLGAFGDFYFTFCFFLIEQNLNQSAFTSQMP
jgi:hypothetical protein